MQQSGGAASSGGSSASGGSAGAGAGAESGCALYSYRSADHVLSVFGDGKLASLEISGEALRELAASPNPATTSWETVVGPYFRDEFFWHVFMLHETDYPKLGPLGQNKIYRPAASGIGLQGVEPAVEDQGKLSAVIFLQDDTQFATGTILHEIMHTWGNFVLPRDDAHWPELSDADGLLGGYPRGSIRDMGDGTYRARSRGFSEPSRASDLEMYLAGLWPKERVQPFLYVKDPEFIETDRETLEHVYRGSGTIEVTLDEFIAAFGARSPGPEASIRHFRMLPIIVTDRPLSLSEWNFYRRTLDALTSEQRWPGYQYDFSYFRPPSLPDNMALSSPESFTTSMWGEATLQTSGLVEALAKPELAECVRTSPARGAACGRLIARAEACGIAPSRCDIDDQFSPAEADCIAGCADKDTCEVLQRAAAGIRNLSENTYINCALSCQCRTSRNCHM